MIRSPLQNENYIKQSLLHGLILYHVQAHMIHLILNTFVGLASFCLKTNINHKKAALQQFLSAVIFCSIPSELLLHCQRKQKHLGRTVYFTVVDQKYASGYKCRQLTMGGAIAHSVTRSQTFDTDFRSLEIEIVTPTGKHFQITQATNKQNAPFSSLSLRPEPSSPTSSHSHPDKNHEVSFCNEIYSTFFELFSTITRGTLQKCVFKSDLSFRETFLLI